MNYMQLAIEEAEKAAHRGSVPVGAVIVCNNTVISAAGNEVLMLRDPTAHAEILAIRHAATSLNTVILNNCDMYVTLEPCAMCAQAISLSRIRRLYFGAYDEKFGAVMHGSRIFDHALHKPEVICGILETRCAQILKKFFSIKRN